MAQFEKPKFDIEDRQRSRECLNACTMMLSELIDEAVAAGWRREEVALHMADAADDYVLYLATNPLAATPPSNGTGKARANDGGTGETVSKTSLSARGLFLRVR